jgi:light-regulated signal transduction histidine kinase (bacteriophytochrome)
MQSLINDLLAYSRVGTRGADLQPTDLNDVLEKVLRSLRAAIEETGAEVTHDPLPTVPADAGQIGQVLQNLVANALKFRGEEPPRIHVAAEHDAGEWHVRVEDNGIGIAPEFADRIFVLFQRLHSRGEYPGTGIGLAICKKIVDRHGGRIWVEGEPGRGSTFHFTLPDR